MLAKDGWMTWVMDDDDNGCHKMIDDDGNG